MTGEDPQGDQLPLPGFDASYTEGEAKPPLAYSDLITEWMLECRRRAESVVPVPIKEEVWRYQPWGRRVVVLRLPMEKFLGEAQLIRIPEVHMKPNAAGWVLSVGPDICTRDEGHSSVCPMDAPHDLVGKTVLFLKYSGMTLQFSAHAAEFEGDYLSMLLGDIQGVLAPEDTK